MTTRNENINERATGWQKLSKWLKAFDESLDLDPIEYSLSEANRKIDRLETRVKDLEAELATKPTRAH